MAKLHALYFVVAPETCGLRRVATAGWGQNTNHVAVTASKMTNTAVAVVSGAAAVTWDSVRVGTRAANRNAAHSPAYEPIMFS